MIAPQQRTAVVLANPAARRAVPRRTLAAAAEVIRSRGWRVEIEETGSAGETRTRAAHHASAGIDALLACGGDGTLLAVVNGVRAAQADIPVGVIPAGTANVWAAEAGVPASPLRALALLENGTRRRVDLGVARIGGESTEAVRFLLVCGAGLDAAVIESVDARPRWKRRLGRLAFGAPAIAALARMPGVEAHLDLDGVGMQVPRLLLALAANTPRYGGVATLAAGATFDDGLLEVTTFEAGRSPLARLRLVVEALRGGLDARAVTGVEHHRARALSITPRRPIPVEVDGDAIGRCGPDAPLHITVEPRAITMIVGPDRATAGRD